MNFLRSFRVLSICTLMMPLSVTANNVIVSVTNTSDVQRQELVEVGLQDVYAKLGIKKVRSLL